MFGDIFLLACIESFFTRGSFSCGLFISVFLCSKVEEAEALEMETSGFEGSTSSTSEEDDSTTDDNDDSSQITEEPSPDKKKRKHCRGNEGSTHNN